MRHASLNTKKDPDVIPTDAINCFYLKTVGKDLVVKISTDVHGGTLKKVEP